MHCVSLVRVASARVGHVSIISVQFSNMRTSTYIMFRSRPMSGPSQVGRMPRSLIAIVACLKAADACSFLVASYNITERHGPSQVALANWRQRRDLT